MSALTAGTQEDAMVPSAAQQHQQDQSYPAQGKTAGGKVGGMATEVTTTAFSDRIVMTISQEGRLGQWFQVALSPRDPSTYGGLDQPGAAGGNDDDKDDLLPMPHLTAQTLLGASTPERETTGQLYAAQIASSIMTRRPDETRVLLVGLGLKSVSSATAGGSEAAREQFFDLLELVLRTI